MSKTVTHDENRTNRQIDTLRWIAPNKVGRFSDRVLRLSTAAEFSQAVAEFNASTTIEMQLDSHDEAAEMCALLKADPATRYAAVNREGQRWNINAARFDGPSTDELAHMAADGNSGAFWALYARLIPKIERNANDFGVLSTTDGPGAVFDEDDAHQRQVEILLGLLESLDFSTSFVGKFNAEVRDVFHEARRLSKAYTLPQNHDYALVESVVRAHAGDLEAAAEDLAENPDRSRHISRDKFYALVSAMDAGRYVELSADGATEQADPTQSDALASVESGFDNWELDLAWAGFSDRERQILTLRYGLDGNEASAPEEIATSLGLTKRRINQILKGLHDKISSSCTETILKNAPAAQVIQETKPARKAAKVEAPEVPVFPVYVRSVVPALPVQTVADRRANPQDGIRAELLIRVGDKWAALYPQPVPERVEIGVFRSSTESRT